MMPKKVPRSGWRKGDKRLDPKALFGIWKGKPRNIWKIRQKGWKRD